MIRHELSSDKNIQLLIEVMDTAGIMKSLSQEKRLQIDHECRKLVIAKCTTNPSCLVTANKEVLTDLVALTRSAPPVLTDPLDVSHSALKQEQRSRFDSELAQKRLEFEESVARTVPEIPSFQDESDESEPIDILLEKMTRERNLITS